MELAAALRQCLMGGKSGAGMEFNKRNKVSLSFCTYHIISYFFIYNKYIFITCMPGAGINLSSLSILDGKVCWDLYIDGLVISMDGNLLDALGAAIKVSVNYLCIFQKYRIVGVLFISYLFFYFNFL